MSHELRTPLNSILILGQQLAENADKQPQRRGRWSSPRPSTRAGTDLLNLISDILDLSKIESGTVTVECEDLLFTAPARDHRAQLPPRGRKSRNLSFTTDFDPRSAATWSPTRSACMQIVKNLLSNAMKFTAQGSVRAARGLAPAAAGAPIIRCCRRPRTVGREVRASTDTGIGISPEKQKIIFEAFQQADARHRAQVRRHRPGPRHQPRARAPAGRRDPARRASPGTGSTFTLYLPLAYQGAAYAADGYAVMFAKATPSAAPAGRAAGAARRGRARTIGSR